LPATSSRDSDTKSLGASTKSILSRFLAFLQFSPYRNITFLLEKSLKSNGREAHYNANKISLKGK
jgi:hypothetical protein